jgi:hypothetical protein
MRSALFLLGVTALVAAPELRAQPEKYSTTAVQSPTVFGGGVPYTPNLVCSMETKEKTRSVYGCAERATCQAAIPHCFSSLFGHSDCQCELKTFRVLTKKTCPDGYTPVCRPKEAACAGACQTCMPTGPVMTGPTVLPGPVPGPTPRGP